MNVGAGEFPLAVALEDVEGNTGNKIGLGIEADFLLALAFVGNTATERVDLLGSGFGGDVQLEVDREGEADNVEAGADVGGRARNLDDARHGWSRLSMRRVLEDFGFRFLRFVGEGCGGSSHRRVFSPTGKVPA